MTFAITPAIRDAVRQALTGSATYDPSTMRISRKGMVSAKTDPNKTLKPQDNCRYYVGHAEDIAKRVCNT